MLFCRFVPPCKKVCMEELTKIVAASRVQLKESFHQHLEVEGLDLSISGGYCCYNHPQPLSATI